MFGASDNVCGFRILIIIIISLIFGCDGIVFGMAHWSRSREFFFFFLREINVFLANKIPLEMVWISTKFIQSVARQTHMRAIYDFVCVCAKSIFVWSLLWRWSREQEMPFTARCWIVVFGPICVFWWKYEIITVIDSRFDEK